MSDVRVFINYRRRDTRHVAGRLRDRIERALRRPVGVRRRRVHRARSRLRDRDRRGGQQLPGDAGADRRGVAHPRRARGASHRRPERPAAPRDRGGAAAPHRGDPGAGRRGDHAEEPRAAGVGRAAVAAPGGAAAPRLVPQRHRAPARDPRPVPAGDDTEPGTMGLGGTLRSWRSCWGSSSTGPPSTEAVAASRDPRGNWAQDDLRATLLWLLPVLPVVLAAILVAARKAPGAALGCLIGSILWVVTSLVFVSWRAAGVTTGAHLLALVVLVLAARTCWSRSRGSAPVRRQNRGGPALAAALLLAVSIALRVGAPAVARAVTGDTSVFDWGHEVAQPTFWLSVLIPVVICLPRRCWPDSTMSRHRRCAPRQSCRSSTRCSSGPSPSPTPTTPRLQRRTRRCSWPGASACFCRCEPGRAASRVDRVVRPRPRATRPRACLPVPGLLRAARTRHLAALSSVDGPRPASLLRLAMHRTGRRSRRPRIGRRALVRLGAAAELAWIQTWPRPSQSGGVRTAGCPPGMPPHTCVVLSRESPMRVLADRCPRPRPVSA